METSKKPLIAFVITIFMLSACARDMSSETYVSSSASGKVLEGKVLTARSVTIKDSDKLQDNTAGMLGGGLLGGVAASSAGKGTGKGLAAIGGALVGAGIGALVQDKLGTSKGMEYVVRIDKKYIGTVPAQRRKSQITYGVNSASEDVSQSIAVEETKTDLISVVQGGDLTFQPGQAVLIIYSNDRPRLAPAN